MKNNSPFRPIALGKHFEIHIMTVVLFCVAFAFSFAKLLLETYAVVLIHEFAHFVAAKYCGVSADKLVIMPFGVTMRLKKSTIENAEDELKIAAAGPISNVVMAATAIVLLRTNIISFDKGYYLAVLNFGIALVNIIPALPLDGGRMLKAYLTLQIGCIKAYNITIAVTKIAAAVMIVTGVAVFFVTGFNFSFFMIGAFLVANTLSEQREKKLVLMREILYSRQKLAQSDCASGGVIDIMEYAPARKALKKLNYNKYYTINIVDSDMNVLGVVTETMLIQALIQYGVRITAKEVLTNFEKR